jgi:hypothetical protein
VCVWCVCVHVYEWPFVWSCVLFAQLEHYLHTINMCIFVCVCVSRLSSTHIQSHTHMHTHCAGGILSSKCQHVCVCVCVCVCRLHSMHIHSHTHTHACHTAGGTLPSKRNRWFVTSRRQRNCAYTYTHTCILAVQVEHYLQNVTVDSLLHDVNATLTLLIGPQVSAMTVNVAYIHRCKQYSFFCLCIQSVHNDRECGIHA